MFPVSTLSSGPGYPRVAEDMGWFPNGVYFLSWLVNWSDCWRGQAWLRAFVYSELKGAKMKITIDIDCSPEEARKFMGLPDVASMNEDLVAALDEKLRASLAGEDPGALFREWFSGGAEGFGKLQKEFWSQFSGGSGRDGADR